MNDKKILELTQNQYDILIHSFLDRIKESEEKGTTERTKILKKHFITIFLKDKPNEVKEEFLK